MRADVKRIDKRVKTYSRYEGEKRRVETGAGAKKSATIGQVLGAATRRRRAELSRVVKKLTAIGSDDRGVIIELLEDARLGTQADRRAIFDMLLEYDVEGEMFPEIDDYFYHGESTQARRMEKEKMDLNTVRESIKKVKGLSGSEKLELIAKIKDAKKIGVMAWPEVYTYVIERKLPELLPVLNQYFNQS